MGTKVNDADRPGAGSLGTVILGVAESDAHAVANRIIAESLRLEGFTVVNTGVCTSLTEFCDAYRAWPDALAVAIGSVNGHAYDDLRELPTLRARGLLACPVILGGNLSVGPRTTARDHRRLRGLGVDHLLEDATQLPDLLHALAAARGRVEAPVIVATAAGAPVAR